MLPSKTSFMDHFRWLRWAAKAHGVQVILDLDTMVAFLRKDGQHWTLLPRFVAEVDGMACYHTQFTDESTHLAGWMAAPSQGWPAAKDKLIFKRAALKLGLPVPEFSQDEEAGMERAIVKRSTGSFGHQVHGPYRSSRERALVVAEGEYYERFVEGHDLKVWYWGAQPVALERDTVPTVVGDGESSFRALILERLRTRPRITPDKLARILARCESLLRFDGLAFDDVPAKGTRQRVEFRYGTDLMLASDRVNVDLSQNADPQWELLRDAGPKLLQMLPETLRHDTMFAVDAVQDAAGRIWLLEMNSHPTVHPLMYDPMVRSLIAKAPSPAAKDSTLQAA